MKPRHKQILASSLAAMMLLAVSPVAAFAARDNGRDNGPRASSSLSLGTSVSQRFQAGNEDGNSQNDRGNAYALGHLIAPGWMRNQQILSVRQSSSDQSNNSSSSNDKDDSADDAASQSTDSSTSPSEANLPPVVTGVSSPTVLDVGQTGTWSVSAYDPGNGSLSYSVDWGDNASRPMFAAMAMPVFTQTSTFTHSYSAPGTYTVIFTVEDSAGLTAKTTVTVHVIANATNEPAPVISGFSASAVNKNHGVAAWTTDERTASSLWLSTTSPVDTSGTPYATRNGLAYYHRIALNNLDPGTTYYVVVMATNKAGLTATSSEASFTTPTPPSLSPEVSSITGPDSITAGVQGTWTVNASDPRNEQLSYSVNWGDNPPIMGMLSALFRQPFNQTSTFTHVYANPGTYTATFTVTDSSGLSARSSTTVEVTAAGTTTPPVASTTIPVISSVTATAGTSTAAVDWSTDQPADSTVYYSTSSPVINGSNTLFTNDGTLKTSHSIDLAGLAPATEYFYVVASSDSAGTATSSEASFTTEALATSTASTSPTISNAVAMVGSNSVHMTWNTSEPADSEAYYSTSSPVVIGASSTTATIDSTLSVNHDLTVTGLAPATVYHFLIRTVDASGNAESTAEFTVTTAPLI